MIYTTYDSMQSSYQIFIQTYHDIGHSKCITGNIITFNTFTFGECQVSSSHWIDIKYADISSPVIQPYDINVDKW